jgi:nicotinamide riboside transporter PnuC
MLWILTAFSITGVILNVKRRRESFYFWAVSNAIWAIIDYQAGIYAQAALFGVYFALAIWGIISWRKLQP